MDSKAVPYIYIVDKISGKSIMHVRLAVLKSGRMTHTFELDYLLDLVKDANKNKAETQPSPGQEPNAGVKTQPQAAPKPLGTPAAKPTKIPTKQKLDPQQPVGTQPPVKAGQQMGKEPEDKEAV
jgi:hypothetical protein